MRSFAERIAHIVFYEQYSHELSDEPVTEPENLVLQILREMRAEMATKSELADLRSEMNSRFADIASDFIEAEKRLRQVEKRLLEQGGGTRRAVMEYHMSVIGHGNSITELQERVSRLEALLEPPAPEAH